jgi:hypothetical protein
MTGIGLDTACMYWKNPPGSQTFFAEFAQRRDGADRREVDAER